MQFIETHKYKIIVASVLLNVILLGLVLGGVVKGPGGKFKAHQQRLEHVVSSMPGEQRQAFKQRFSVHKERLIQNKTEIRALKAEIKRILSQDPLEKQVLEAKFRKMRDLMHEIQENMHSFIVNEAVNIPVEKRQYLFPSRKHDQRPPRPERR